MLGRLNDRERRVLISRYGIGGADEQTLEQIGRELRVTKERVRQIESRPGTNCVSSHVGGTRAASSKMPAIRDNEVTPDPVTLSRSSPSTPPTDTTHLRFLAIST